MLSRSAWCHQLPRVAALAWLGVIAGLIASAIGMVALVSTGRHGIGHRATEWLTNTEAHAGKDWLNHHGVPLTALDAVPTGAETLQSIVAVASDSRSSEGSKSLLLNTITDPPARARKRALGR